MFLLDLASIQFIFGPIVAMLIAARFSKFVIKMVDQITLQLGLLGTLIGGVGMMQNMDDPQAIGPAYAVCFLTLLYSFVLKIFASQANEAMILPVPETRTRDKIFAGLLLAVLMVLPMENVVLGSLGCPLFLFLNQDVRNEFVVVVDELLVLVAPVGTPTGNAHEL